MTPGECSSQCIARSPGCDLQLTQFLHLLLRFGMTSQYEGVQLYLVPAQAITDIEHTN